MGGRGPVATVRLRRRCRRGPVRHVTVTRTRHAVLVTTTIDRAPPSPASPPRPARSACPSCSPACCPARRRCVAAVGQVVVDLQPPGAKDFVVGPVRHQRQARPRGRHRLASLLLGAGLGLLATPPARARGVPGHRRFGVAASWPRSATRWLSPAIVRRATVDRRGRAVAPGLARCRRLVRRRLPGPRRPPCPTGRAARSSSGPEPSGSPRSSPASAGARLLERQRTPAGRRRPAAAGHGPGADRSMRRTTSRRRPRPDARSSCPTTASTGSTPRS